MLAIFDNFDSEFSESPWLQNIIRKLHEKNYAYLLQRIPSNTKVLGPWIPPDKISPGYISFADLFQDLSLRDKEIPEFLELTKKIVAILTKHGGASARHVAYALSAPHTESLPFKILALEKIISQEDQVLLIHPFGPHGEIITALCAKKRILLTKKFSVWAFFLSAVISLQKTTSLLKEVFQLTKSSLGATLRKPPFQPGNGIILFLANRERSLRYLKPVMENLRQRGSAGLLIGGIRNSGGLEKNSDAERVVYLTDYMNPWDPIAASAKNVCAWLRSKKEVLAIDVTFKEIPLAPLYFSQIRKIFLTKGFLAGLYSRSGTKLINSIHPKAVFSSDPAELSSVIFSEAHENRIPATLYACMDNGLPSTAQVWKANLIGDRVLTLNEHLRAYLEDATGGGKPIKMVGDVLVTPPLSPSEKNRVLNGLCAELRITPAKPILLLLSRHVSEALTLANKELLFQSAFSVAKEMDMQIVVKCHPHENIEITRREMEHWNLNGPILPDSFPHSLREISSVATLVCNFPGSSSSIEAMIENTPVLVIGTPLQVQQYNSVENAAAFVKLGAVAWAQDSREAIRIARSIIYDGRIKKDLIEKMASFLLRYQGETDGSSAKRIADEILSSFGEPR